MNRWFHRTVLTILAVLALVDAGLELRILSAQRAHRPIVSLLRQQTTADSGSQLMAFDSRGVRLSGSRRPEAASVVRYASSRCHFCREDVYWSKLALELERRSVPIIIVLPGSSAEFPPGDLMPSTAQQAAFVSVEWTRRFRLTFTPTLLVFDSHGQLVWWHEGTLAAADVTSVLSAVGPGRRAKLAVVAGSKSGDGVVAAQLR